MSSYRRNVYRPDTVGDLVLDVLSGVHGLPHELAVLLLRRRLLAAAICLPVLSIGSFFRLSMETPEAWGVGYSFVALPCPVYKLDDLGGNQVFPC